MYHFKIFQTFRVLEQKKRLTLTTDIKCKIRPVYLLLRLWTHGISRELTKSVERRNVNLWFITEETWHLLTISAYKALCFEKKTFKRCIIRVPDWKLARLLSRFCFGRICRAVTFYFNAPLKTGTAGDMQTRAICTQPQFFMIWKTFLPRWHGEANNPSQIRR